LINGKKLTELFAEKLKNKNIEESSIPLYICASSLESGKCVTFSRGSVVDAIRASISIPGIFTPVQIKGIFLVDGGITNPVPVNILSENNHKKIVGIDLNSPLEISYYREMPGIMNTINRSITIMSYYLTNTNLEKINTWKILRPDLTDYGVFEFHRGKELIELGYKTVFNNFKT
jgi:NTE family protein